MRDLALRALAEENGFPPEERESLDREKHAIDASLEEGLHVYKPKGQKRFTYEVTDPEALSRWLRERHGADLLSEEDINVLLEFGEFLQQAAYGEGKWVLQTKEGNTYNTDYELFQRFEDVLRKSGRLE